MTLAEKLLPWLCLKTAPEVGIKTALRILELYGTPQNFVGKAEHPLYEDQFLSDKTKAHLQEAKEPKCLSQIQKLCTHYEIGFTSILDEDYPEALSNIYSPPLLIYYRGDISAVNSGKILAVVGTRKPSAYGREMTKKLLTPLCERKVKIISGLAMGIDTIAHQTAVASGAPTIAVLAGGVEEIYPAMNRELAQKIINNGVILSEYEPGSKMERWNFPARNRIVSALSEAVFIVEGSMSSGAMLTGKFALEQNREVLALPGNINITNAQGPNYLIKTGATVVTCTEDLLRCMGIEAEEHIEQMDIFDHLSENEQRIYAVFRAEQRNLSFDELMIITSESFGQLSVALLNLELKGVIAKAGGNSYIML